MMTMSATELDHAIPHSPRRVTLFAWFFTCGHCSMPDLIRDFNYCPRCGLRLNWDTKQSGPAIKSADRRR